VEIHAIILAAGAGVRIGTPKALLRVGTKTFLSRVVETFTRPGVARVIAVLGHEGARVREDAGLPRELSLVVNPRPEQGMLSSVWIGLETAEAAGAEAVLLHPVDHPLIDARAVDRVVVALEQGARIVVAAHEGRRGHPAGFAQSVFADLRAADPARGARAVLADHPDWVTHVPGGPGCRAGINSPADYARLIGDATPPSRVPYD
jgi:CTP:molybdopterin cytidylyltransferase MocA